jgi:hypothetical protein
MSARHWYDMELEHGRSAIVGCRNQPDSDNQQIDHQIVSALEKALKPP